MKKQEYLDKCNVLFKKAKDKGVELIFNPESYSPRQAC